MRYDQASKTTALHPIKKIEAMTFISNSKDWIVTSLKMSFLILRRDTLNNLLIGRRYFLSFHILSWLSYVMSMYYKSWDLLLIRLLIPE